MLDSEEDRRLGAVFEDLRLRLLDLSKRNRMLNYPVGARSRRQLQFFDEVIEDVHSKLVVDDVSLRIAALPEPEATPPEEKTEDFIAALAHAKVSDIEYLVALEAIDASGGTDEATLEKAESALRERVRSQLGLPPRPRRTEIHRAEHARLLGIDPNPELAPHTSKPSHSDSSLQTLRYPDELESQLDKIRAEARLAEQEAGLSTLYLGLGFLEWYDSETTDKPCFAPLLLLPVKIEESKQRGKKVFYLSAREDNAESNISLQKLLASDRFGRVLPAFGSEDGDALESLEAYFERVRQSIEGLHRWQVRRWLVLGHFAFHRIAIYEDTNPARWPSHPVNNPLIRSLLSGFENDDAEGTGALVPEDYQIDSPEVERAVPLLIQDADASQHSALVDVMKGKNLVIHGPPGTGKSQTITNVIANVMAAGKTVLFIAEKQAALEVVKRRLDRSGLGEFCLELHSDKSAPRNVVKSLEQRAHLEPDHRDSLRTEDPVWQRSRDLLSAYANALNEDRSFGRTPFNAIWRALNSGGAERPPNEVVVPKELLGDATALEDARGKLQVFADLCTPFTQAYGPPGQSPWSQLKLPDMNHLEQQKLVRVLEDLRAIHRSLAELTATLASAGFTSRDQLAFLSELARELDEGADETLISSVAGVDYDALETAVELTRQERFLNAQLSGIDDAGTVKLVCLQRAEQIAAASSDRALLDLPPREMFAQIEQRHSEAKDPLARLEDMRPALAILGIGERDPLASVDAAALATIFAASVDPAYRRWVVSSAAEQKEYAPLLAQWRALLDQERALRSVVRIPDSEPWPAVEWLEQARQVFERNALSRVLGRFSREVRQAEELVTRLGIVAAPGEMTRILASILEHLRALEDFAMNASGRRLFGDGWAGIDTPFKDIESGSKQRSLYLEKNRSLDPTGHASDRLFVLGDAEWDRLSSYREAAQNWRARGVEPADTTQSIASVAHRWHSQLQHSQALLDLDPGRFLASQAMSVTGLLLVLDLQAKQEKAQRARDELPATRILDVLAPSEADLEKVEAALAWVRKVSSVDLPDPARQALLTPGAKRFRRELAEVGKAYDTLAADEETALGRLEGEFGLDELRLLPEDGRAGFVEELINHVDELAEHVALAREASELDAIGLSALVDWAWETPNASLTAVFDHLVAASQAENAITVSDVLGRTSGKTLEAQRRLFVESDHRRIEAARTELRRKLTAADAPLGVRSGAASQLTEMGLLLREFPKQRRHTPVRGLMRRAGNAIRALKPCTMMSPLSLAKYLPAVAQQYDVLVIDEASQMRPEDALGAMLRAKQIIVVGDQKQLPPTSFFDRNSDSPSDNDDEDVDEVDDESILERCQKVFGNVRQLKWHYRSRCESLIRFSNENFYEDRLITFPAPQPDAFSIDLVRVDGTYQARRNVAEAERVAEEAIRFMRTFAGLDSDEIPTLGIVAINTEQRELVRETIARFEANDDLVSTYREKVAEKGEEVFVKNLENVQGDERDYIFISLTYGRAPNATAVAQRFGPINSKQGHRRLNVLFSRARQRLALFSSMGSSDIRVSETANEGVVKLKQYLEYAERRGRMPHQSVGGYADSDFEEAVAERLANRGYEVVPQVGVSGFRIDLGVLHPDNRGQFLAGIECDGAAYHSSRSARDRDRLRQEILEGMGWTILRIWSTDWFAGPDAETDKLVRRLDEIRSRAENTTPAFVLHIPSNPSEVGSETSEDAADEATTETDTAVALVDFPSGTSQAEVPAPPDDNRSEEVDVSTLVDGDAPLTEAQAYRVLAYFRERVIAPEGGELHRSILREGMIETFVRQRIADPEDWFTKVPTYQRAATDPVEKKKYLEPICSIIARIESTGSGRTAQSRTVEPKVTAALAKVEERQPPRAPQAWQGREYVRADVSALHSLRPDRLYDDSYAPTLRALVDLIVETEGPIFADVLATRVARAHGKDRTGAIIQGLAAAATSRKYPRTFEGDRELVWPEGARPYELVPFRTSASEVRGYDDVPEVELASLALPYLGVGMQDEAILEKFAEHFGLQRLRQPSRLRFLKAIGLARGSAA